VIVTVTLNPSLDRTIEVARLARGCVQRGAQNVSSSGLGPCW
jgi:fructose-1-phosphate kinase PfkB-like protein